MKINAFFRPYLPIYVLLGLTWACSSPKPVIKLDNGVPFAPDYTKSKAWAALPELQDPADEAPKGLKNEQDQALADVFWLHPTSYTEAREPTDPWNAAIEDPKINKSTDGGSIRFQASIFNEVGRVYAPRYRQAHISAYFTKDHDLAKRVFGLAYEDVKNAFQHYLNHYNQGRPIIIASHSQGATHAQRLLKEFFDEKPLQKQLVVAYLVGMPVPKDLCVNIKPCETPEETGCFCTWRTYLKGNKPDFPGNANNIAVTNPLTWSTTSTYAARELNKGAVLRNFNKILPAVCDAQVEAPAGLLWINRPHFPGSFLYRDPNYHIGDLNLFYLNIRENASLRVERFTQK